MKRQISIFIYSDILVDQGTNPGILTYFHGSLMIMGSTIGPTKVSTRNIIIINKESDAISSQFPDIAGGMDLSRVREDN